MNIKFYKGSYENLMSKGINLKKIDSIYLADNNDLYFVVDSGELCPLKPSASVNESKSADNMFLNDYINEIFDNFSVNAYSFLF